MLNDDDYMVTSRCFVDNPYCPYYDNIIDDRIDEDNILHYNSSYRVYFVKRFFKNQTKFDG